MTDKDRSASKEIVGWAVSIFPLLVLSIIFALYYNNGELPSYSSWKKKREEERKAERKMSRRIKLNPDSS